MLGTKISDPKGIEGSPETINGLGHLDVETELDINKTLAKSVGVHLATGTEVTGYEIHMGLSNGVDCDNPFIKLGSNRDGAISQDGRVFGTYLHGIFTSDAFRAAFLNELGARSDLVYKTVIDETLDELSSHMAKPS